MNDLNNILTEEVISNVLNDTYKFVGTRDSILNSLSDRLDSVNSNIIFFMIFIFFSLIIFFYFVKKQKDIIRIISSICLVCLFVFFTYKNIREKNAIEYSIENNCWSIESDCVIDKYIKNSIVRGETSISYCLKLDYYGEMRISLLMYENIEKYDNVYVICVQDEIEKKYPISVWPAEKTLFIEDLPLP